MSALAVRLYAPPLLFALVATFHTFVPTQAEATGGLFTVTWTLYSDQVGTANQTKTATFPTASGYVGTSPLPKFTVPQSVIKNTTGYATCAPGACRPGYPISKAWYSYWNLRGSFRPNNPYGATMTTTVQFPTTMGNTGLLFTGDPVTPTTTFDGRYDFWRQGSIMITPGPNRFGGTMQFFYGPNHRYYQLITFYTGGNYSTEAFGSGKPPISTYHESQVGEFVIGRQMDRYVLTNPSHVYRAVIGNTIPSSAPCNNSLYQTKVVRPPTNPGCEYWRKNVQYLSTIVPFTTGMITGAQANGYTTTVHTLTGYDNRTPAGLNGVISMVRPRLTHTYVTPGLGVPGSGKRRSAVSTWQVYFHFVPEPGGTAVVIAGAVTLAGLYRRRRHSVKR